MARQTDSSSATSRTVSSGATGRTTFRTTGAPRPVEAVETVLTGGTSALEGWPVLSAGCEPVTEAANPCQPPPPRLITAWSLVRIQEGPLAVTPPLASGIFPEALGPEAGRAPLPSRDAAQPAAFLLGVEGVAGPAGAAHLWALGLTGTPATALVAEKALRAALLRRITRQLAFQLRPMCTPWSEGSSALLPLGTGRALAVVPHRRGASGDAPGEAHALLIGRAFVSLAGRRAGRPAGTQRAEEALRARGGSFRGARAATEAVADEPSGTGFLLIHRECKARDALGELACGGTGTHPRPLAQSGQHPACLSAAALEIRQAPAGRTKPALPIEREAAQWRFAVSLARARTLEREQPPALFHGEDRADLQGSRGGQDDFTRGEWRGPQGSEK